MLEKLCLNFKAELPFHNKKRMLQELLDGLRKRIKNKLDDKNIDSSLAILKEIQQSSTLRNSLSHDNPFRGGLQDLKIVYEDIKNLEDFFRCNDRCKKFVSLDYLNKVDKYISCRCGKKKFKWN